MQTRNDGTYVILPAAAPIVRRPDRAGLPVTMLRQSDGKVRHDGSSAANKQRNYPVAERGRLHGASELDARMRNRGMEHRIVYYRSLEEERQWRISLEKHSRLRWQDKRAHIAGRSVGCFCWCFRYLSHIASLCCNVRCHHKQLIRCGNIQGTKRIRWPTGGTPLVLRNVFTGAGERLPLESVQKADLRIRRKQPAVRRRGFYFCRNAMCKDVVNGPRI